MTVDELRVVLSALSIDTTRYSPTERSDFGSLCLSKGAMGWSVYYNGERGREYVVKDTSEHEACIKLVDYATSPFQG